MYQIKKALTKASILEEITEWDIFKTYIDGLLAPNTSFNSELRNDPVASCRVTNLSKGFVYKDFGIKGVLNCFQYVMLRFGLSFPLALEKIRQDFNLNNIEPYKGNTNKLNSLPKFNIQFSDIVPTVKGSTIIKRKIRNWVQGDVSFWQGKYGITESWLKKVHIDPISDFWIENDKFNGRISPKTLAYCYNYYWSKGVYRRKIYQPYEKENKWFSNVDDTIIQGWDLLPKGGGDLLIITSSLKDAGTIFCNRGIYSIAPNTESTFLPPRIFYQKIKPRWKRIVLWYNNDFPKKINTGIINAKKIAKEYDIEFVFQPDGLEKDPSDFRDVYGHRNFVELCNTLLNL